MRTVALVFALSVFPQVLPAADGDSVDSAVKALYAVISGPAGPRDWARFQALFIDGGRLIPTRMTPQGAAMTVMTPEEYGKRAGANFDKQPFYEAEISRRIETYGNIVHVFSTYESRRAPGEKPFARGINSIQLAKQGNEWKVVTVLWDAEREGNPLPEKYLTSSPR
jgi:hypothetical protein